MLIFNPGYRAGGYPPSNQFPAFYKDRKVNVQGSIGQEGRQAMMERKSGSMSLLAQRAGDSMQPAFRGENARPADSIEPVALNTPLADQPSAAQPLALNPRQFRLDAPDDDQLVPYHTGGPPPPDPGAASVERYSVVAPVRDFVARGCNSLVGQLPHQPRNALERWMRHGESIPVPHDPEDDATLVETGQPALPPPLMQRATPMAIEAGQTALPAGQPALGRHARRPPPHRPS